MTKADKQFDTDVLIIGAGVIGCMAARELSRYQLSVTVLERNSDVCEGSSKSNSGMIHAGFHPRGGSLKGISCVQGNDMYDRICSELDIPLKRTGSLYVAFGPNGEEKLRNKYENGIKNGVPGLKIINGEEARTIEPCLSREVISALWAPTAAIISPFKLVVALYESALKNGVRFELSTEVKRITPLGDAAELPDGWRIETANGRCLTARYVINAAGDQAEPLDSQVHPADLVIRPRRGQFYVFDCNSQVRVPVYQAQEDDEGGILATPTIEGNLLAGPTSENVADYSHTETTAEGLAKVMHVTKIIFPDIDPGDVITSFAGVRANIKNIKKEQKDFVVRRSAGHFVSALGIKNPGMSAAPFLVHRMIELLADDGLETEPDPQFDPFRKAYVPFLQSDRERQRKLIAADPAYARIICRCEKITEGDVRYIAAMDSCPHTIEAIKCRLRTGMGRCQGGFCSPRVLKVLSDVWQTRPEKIPYSEAGGAVCKGKVK